MSSMGGYLHIFLLVNVFFMGILASVAWRHARAHFKPPITPPKKTAPASVHKLHVPQDLRQKLIEDAEARFRSEMDHSAGQLQQNLETTTAQLTKHLEKLGSEIIQDEMKRYHDQIDQMRAQANTALSGAQSSIQTHQQDLEAKLLKREQEMEAAFNQRREQMEATMQNDIEAEKQKMREQLDTKLADAMASFLTETLQHDIDLGAQERYLIKQLEAHKEDFKRELG